MRPVVYLILLASLLTCRVLNAAEDSALAPPVINTVPDSKYGDATRLFQGIPGIERAANGRLWALWYAGGPDEPGEGPGNYVVLVTSGDDGKSWSEPKLVIDPPGPVRAYDPCLWHSPDGRLWLFWAQSYQWWDGRSGVWAIVTENSGDETPKWSAPRRLCNGIMMNKPTVLSTGEWLLPASVWERPADKRTDEGHRHHLGTENGANVHVSRDKGATWSMLGQAKVASRVFDEHMLVERRDGSLWMLVRAAYGIGESTSADRGKTWSAGRESTIPHVNSRFFIRRLNSGKLLLVTHEPPDKKTRSHLVAHLSDDDGRTWSGGLLIDDRKGISYPDGVQAPDGTVYLIYDFSRTGEKLILMATFMEDDVATGKWSSTKARQRVLVNQATGQRSKVSAPKEADKPKADAKKSAPNNVLAPIQDVPGLPRVLLIGDSISMGYTLPVRKLLEGKANVHRIPVNGGPTKNGIANIDKWLGDSKWDVIHFNWGIHDLKYMPDEKRQVEPADYEKNLRSLVAKMKGTGAKLIWCSTTPIPDGELNPPRRFGQVKEYNDIAARVMSDNGVLVNDLNAHIAPEFDRLHTPKDLHYSREGSEFLAKKVAAEIEKALARPIPKP